MRILLLSLVYYFLTGIGSISFAEDYTISLWQIEEQPVDEIAVAHEVLYYIQDGIVYQVTSATTATELTGPSRKHWWVVVDFHFCLFCRPTN